MTKQEKDLTKTSHTNTSDDIARIPNDNLHRYPFFTNKTRKERVIHYLLFIFAILVGSGILFVTLARAEPGVQDQYNHTIGLRKIFYNVIQTTSVSDIRVCVCQPNKKTRAILHDGFETTFSVYDRGGPNPRPGIILIHGNTWLGQRLSTYRLVAHFLAKEGFIVLTFDKVGFGESDDPFGQGPEAVAAAYDYLRQVDKAVDFFIEHTEVDPNNITLLGHSGGAPEALEIGRQNGLIANVVAWGAPIDPTSEDKAQANSEHLANKFYATYEFIYGQKVPDWFSLDMVDWQDNDIVWLPYQQRNHKPLIVMFGEHEEVGRHHVILEKFEMLTEPKTVVFVSRANHYLNTAQSLRWVFYDRKIVDEFVNELTRSIYEYETTID